MGDADKTDIDNDVLHDEPNLSAIQSCKLTTDESFCDSSNAENIDCEEDLNVEKNENKDETSPVLNISCKVKPDNLLNENEVYSLPEEKSKDSEKAPKDIKNIDMFQSDSDEERNGEVDNEDISSMKNSNEADSSNLSCEKSEVTAKTPTKSEAFSETRQNIDDLRLVDYNSDDSDKEMSSQILESKKRKSEDGDSESNDDEYMDAQGDTGETSSIPAKKLKRFFMGMPSSSESDELTSSSESSSDDSSSKSSNEDLDKKRLGQEEENNWLIRDIKHLPDPRWKPIQELKKREIIQNSSYWPVKVCGSRAMVKRFKLHTELDKHAGCVNALHFNQSGTLIASGSDDLRVMLWDWVNSSTHPVVNYESGHKSNIFQSKFLPNCNDATVVSSARDGQVRVADISTTGSCRGTKKIAQHRGSAHKLALDTDARSTFLSCGEDGVVFSIDLRCDKPANKLVTVKAANKKVPLYSIHSNPSRSHEFALSGRSELARIFDRRMLSSGDSPEPVKLYCPHHLRDLQDSTANITCLVYNWDGSELLCSYNDEDIYLFDTSHSTGADYVTRYKGHRNNATVKGVNFYGPHSEFIVSGSDCGNIFFWEKESSRIVTLVNGDQGGVVNVLEPHPSLPLIATSGLDHEVKIWMPSDDPMTNSKLDKLHSLMLSNYREREEERRTMPDMIDGHMLLFLMRRLRRRSRMRRRGDDHESTSDDDDEDDDSSSDLSPSSDDSGRMNRCVQS